MCSHLTSSF